VSYQRQSLSVRQYLTVVDSKAVQSLDGLRRSLSLEQAELL